MTAVWCSELPCFDGYPEKYNTNVHFRLVYVEILNVAIVKMKYLVIHIQYKMVHAVCACVW